MGKRAPCSAAGMRTHRQAITCDLIALHIHISRRRQYHTFMITRLLGPDRGRSLLSSRLPVGVVIACALSTSEVYGAASLSALGKKTGTGYEVVTGEEESPHETIDY